jgi:formate C-acetyltransferase/benzylsuccinate synthase
MEELRKATEANWEGYEEMRMDFVKAPKWGNDDDYVDQIWVRVYEDLGKMSWSVRDINGQPRPTLPESIAMHVVQATKIGALPNGRRLGDPFSRQIGPCRYSKGYSLESEVISISTSG